MPAWLVQVATNAGPVAAIMAFMWWRAEKRANLYEERWARAVEELPDKIIGFTEEQRQTHEKLVRAIWASLKRERAQ